jgi:hypothetical protein
VGHPLLYGTTREFLNHLGLQKLGQLPQLPSLEGVISDREALKAFATDLGEEITDEELDSLRQDDGEPADAVSSETDTPAPADEPDESSV